MSREKDAQDVAGGILETLVFNNADAKPKTTKILCDSESVPAIMAWYGEYHAGDRYTVALNGRNVRMDHNGEMLHCEAGR